MLGLVAASACRFDLAAVRFMAILTLPVPGQGLAMLAGVARFAADPQRFRFVRQSPMATLTSLVALQSGGVCELLRVAGAAGLALAQLDREVVRSVARSTRHVAVICAVGRRGLVARAAGAHTHAGVTAGWMWIVAASALPHLALPRMIGMHVLVTIPAGFG